MAASAAIRLQVETALEKRVPAALTLKIKHVPELFSTGIVEVDVALGGGIPRGSITEISGAASTGKTSFALSSIAAITMSGASCAWVDVSDALSPESAAGANIVLKRLLWLRMYEQNRMTVTRGKFLLVEGLLQNQDGDISVKPSSVRVLELGPIDMRSHDFH